MLSGVEYTDVRDRLPNHHSPNLFRIDDTYYIWMISNSSLVRINLAPAMNSVAVPPQDRFGPYQQPAPVAGLAGKMPFSANLNGTH